MFKLFLGMLIILLAGPQSDLSSDHSVDLVNPIIGNSSYVARFGHQPDGSLPEEARIFIHLQHVYQELSRHHPQGLSEQQYLNRKHLLGLLQQYTEQRRYPKNSKYAERRPCFIDGFGNICAVGYLVEQTAGKELAQAINEEYQYATIYEMKSEALDRWIAQSGLSKREVAMIQPAYQGPNPAPVNPAPVRNQNHVVISSLFMGTNLALNGASILQMRSDMPNKGVAGISLLTGAGQLTMGMYNL